jgi:hypothetical protein
MHANPHGLGELRLRQTYEPSQLDDILTGFKDALCLVEAA